MCRCVGCVRAPPAMLEREVGQAYRLEREAREVVVIFLLSMFDSEVKLMCLGHCANSA